MPALKLEHTLKDWQHSWKAIIDSGAAIGKACACASCDLAAVGNQRQSQRCFPPWPGNLSGSALAVVTLSTAHKAACGALGAFEPSRSLVGTARLEHCEHESFGWRGRRR